MKKLIIIIIFILLGKMGFSQTADLNGVTFGFGAGYSHTFDNVYDYSLTTDGSNNLKTQVVNKNAFVISSVIMVKLGKIAADNNSQKLIKQSNKKDYEGKLTALNSKLNYKRNNQSLLLTHNDTTTDKEISSLKQAVSDEKIGFFDHLSVNLALNLINVTPDASFNKSIDGGLGLGYFITPSLQFALFYDISQKRQLRDYIVQSYQNSPIPSDAKTVYNALDTADDKLFYNKTVSGLSFKLVFSLSNKKSE